MTVQREQKQLDAAHPEHSAWVSAHAGSGKTFILIDRLSRLLLSGVPAERILCITFTKAAATEMSERLYQRLSHWSLCDEAALCEELHGLEGVMPNSKKLLRAKNLFAEMLEAHHKGNIQTIHSFCQSVLKRFPIEADIYPNFQTMDEYESKALLKEAQLSVLEDSKTNQEALKIIAQNISAQTFDDIFAEIIRNRKKIKEMIGSAPEKLSSLQKKWGISSGESPTSIREQILSQRPLAHKNLSLEAYIDKFFTKEKKPRKKLPHDMELSEQERVGALMEKANQAQTLLFSAALLKIAGHFLSQLDKIKKQKGLLDYEDLISKTLDLFQNRSAGQWVLYRLDGGIDHILIDEAQDTNPEQWQLIEKLSEEFFAGESYKQNACSLFVVGDAKQSIFSFQGAAVDGFAEQEKKFAQLAKNANKNFISIPLAVSFRSAPQILYFVDGLLSRMTLSETPLDSPPHAAHRTDASGLVEIWPIYTASADGSKVEKMLAPDDLLAEHIAQKIEALLREGDCEEKDILVLLRRRNAFFDSLIRTLKKKNLSVAGSDRLMLAKELPIQDLLSLAKWVLLPQDDLSFAEVLKSPLCAVTEAQLMKLAVGRDKNSLWEALLAQQNQFPEVVAFLRSCLERADFVSVFDFFSFVLDVQNRRGHFVALMGEEVLDPLDAFGHLALSYEKNHTSSLQNFIEWFDSAQAEIKRDKDRSNEIRLMTIHGAKGLEAKVVFFIDVPPSHASKNYFRPLKGVPLFSLTDHKIKALEQVREEKKALDGLEEARLLYVALTRACDQLYVSSYKRKGDSQPQWYELMAEQQEPQKPNFGPATAPTAQTKKPKPLQNIFSYKIIVPKAQSQMRHPSLLMEQEKKKLSPLGESKQDSPAALRGTILHEALRYGVAWGAATDTQTLTNFLQKKFSNHANCQTLAEKAMDLINNKIFAEIFHPTPEIQALNEAPVQALFADGEKTLSGKIDRLLLHPAQKCATIIDYKSDSAPPETAPEPYQRQLAAYALVLSKIYPDWQVRCALLWTSVPRLEWLDEKTLEKQKKAII